jgi:hypothetical protein
VMRLLGPFYFEYLTASLHNLYGHFYWPTTADDARTNNKKRSSTASMQVF